ncbi:MAG: hypothetical protein ACFCUE_09685 [Candidatus Bathyarchaeia archaeon]|jgi:Na+/phosphate symporter
MEKIEESAQYLKGCTSIETQAFKLYETLAKKINHPESSFVLGFAYDSIKNAKIIQAMLQTIDLPEEDNENKKTVSLLASEVYTFLKKIEKTNSIDQKNLIEIFKELVRLEDLVSKLYSEFMESNYPKVLAEEMAKFFTMDYSNFKKVFEGFVTEKQKHRETMIEIIYCIGAKEAERAKNMTPTVKYQNPDAWVNTSSLHAFSRSNY